MTAYMDHKNLANEVIDGVRAVQIADGVHRVLDRIASAEQLGKLGRYVEDLLHQIAREIGSGNIDADPVARGPQERACDRCDFAAACAFQEGRGGDRVRYIRTVKPEEFWQFVDAENGKEGSTCR